MDLSSFSSFYEMFAALNLAYAGSENFRFGLNDTILKSEERIKSVEKTINETKNKITVLSVESEGHPITLEKISAISAHFYKYSDIIKAEKKINLLFVKSFHSMFIVSGLYCIYFLFMLGYAQFYKSSDPCLIPTCIFWANSFLALNAFIFLRSYHKKYNKEIHYRYIAASIFLIIFLSVQFYYINLFEITTSGDLIEGRLNMTLSVLIAMSSFIFHFYRSFSHEFLYRIRFHVLTLHTNKNLTKIMEYKEWEKAFDDNNFSSKIGLIQQAYTYVWKKIDPFYRRIDKQK